MSILLCRLGFMSIGIEKANMVAVYPSDKTVITNIHKMKMKMNRLDKKYTDLHKTY
jgi:hypothetical protein